MESPSVAAGGAVNVPLPTAASATTATSAPPPLTPATAAAATIITAYPSPHLKKVLRSYQSAASSSLSGPNGILSAAPGHHCAHPTPELVYYAYSNLPLPVVVAASSLSAPGKGSSAARLIVKDEPVTLDEHLPYYPSQHQPSTEGGGGKTCWPKGAGNVDEFKVWKLKRPAFSSSTATIAANKDAMDLSPGRDKLVDSIVSPIERDTTVKAVSPPPSAIHQQPAVLAAATGSGPSFPILSAADRSWKHAERSETTLEGHRIACFMVGGEPRLCLMQILNSVLRQFHIVQIHAVCDELQINCSRCTAEQLDSLKASPAIIPRAAASCGLITKSDAQRLCSALLRRTNVNPMCRNVKVELEADGRGSESGWFRVYHQCFGKCEGLCRPELYSTPDSSCIECTDCGLLLSPADFVGHAHRSVENRTCHWGFDAANWRSYLLLARRQQQEKQKSTEMLLTQLDEFKNRFLGPAAAPIGASSLMTTTLAIKRKLESRLAEEEEDAEDDALGEPEKRCAIGRNGSQSPKPYDGRCPRESPPPLEEASAPRVRHDEAGHPNVTLAPPRPRCSLPSNNSSLLNPTSVRHQHDPSLGNPEIELSSTDTEDSDSIPSQSGDTDKLVWELPAHLSHEVKEVEQLLERGGCDSTNGRLILQAFRRLCLRLNWAQEQRHGSSPVAGLLKLRTDLTTEQCGNDSDGYKNSFT